MGDTSREILEAALRLPREERAAIAEELLVSVDGEDEGAAQAWAALIRRRVDDALAGRAQGPDCRVALDEIRERVRNGR
jgi:putative addiction module component (TIGR02574 family)